jgi:D-alanyl-D-alanine carboxypeptidase
VTRLRVTRGGRDPATGFGQKHTAMRRRAFLTLAPALAATHAVAGVPINLPFGAKKKPPVDLAAIASETGAPGVGAAVVTAKGVEFLDVAGERRRGYGEPVRKDDLWHLGSDTKPMTSTLVAKLVETGRTSWSAKLPALFSDLKLDPAWADARLDDVLAHRAGLTDQGVIDTDFVSRAHADPRPAPEQRTALVQALLAKPPPRPPGGFDYANVNYVMAGAAIERITRTSWEEAITAVLFRPLGMGSAGFGAPTGAEPWGHQPGDGGRLQPMDPAGVADLPRLFAPSSGVHASLGDWARFVRLFVSDGGGYLSADTLSRLCRPWGGQDGEYGMAWQAFAERGWAQGPVLAQEGTNGLWRADCQIAPARAVAILSVANAQDGGGVEATQRAQLELIKAFAA